MITAYPTATMHVMSDSHAVLTTAEVAASLRVSEPTVRRWCASGRLPALLAGGSWRIDERDVEAFLARPTTARLDRYQATECAVRIAPSGGRR